MGNCQANDAAAAAAAAVVQHSDGHAERLYWPTTADEVMRNHPDHYVAQITLSGDGRAPSAAGSAVRLTKIRLLKHTEMLLIGRVYRLISSEEVTKELRARKRERMKKAQNFQIRVEERTNMKERTNMEDSVDSSESDSQAMDQEETREKEKHRSSGAWRPSLESISEIGS